MGGEPILIKLAVVAAFGIVVPGIVMATSLANRRWTRIWLVLLIATAIRFPVMTIDFHHGFRHNVRGWEICWSDYIAMGLIATRLAMGGLPRLGLIGIVASVHVGLLLLSSVQGMDVEFSGFTWLARYAGY